MLDLIQVGLGPWGFDWITKVAPLVPEVRWAALVDTDGDRRDAAAEHLPDALLTADLDDALARLPGAAVLAVVPLPAHAPAAGLAIDAGRSVLVEKPFADSVAAAIDLVVRAERKGICLGVAQTYRCYPAVRTALRLIGDGAIGDVLSIAVDYRRLAIDGVGHRHWDIRPPLLLDMAAHYFDIMRLIAGAEADAVSAVAWNAPGSGFIDPPAAVATVRFGNAVVASLRGAWNSRGHPTAYGGAWTVDGTAGSIAFTFNAGAHEVADPTADAVSLRPLHGEPSPVPLDPMDRIERAATLTAFGQWIATGSPPPLMSTGRNNLGTLALTLGAVRSADQNGAWQPLAESGLTVS